MLDKHIIDCDSAPFIPPGMYLIEHIPGGQIEWNPANFELFFEESQKSGGYIKGERLWDILKSKRVLNANFLDYLLEHQELIPDACEDLAVFFWGTKYEDSDGNLCVRYLRKLCGEWGWSYNELFQDFISISAAAIFDPNS